MFLTHVGSVNVCVVKHRSAADNPSAKVEM